MMEVRAISEVYGDDDTVIAFNATVVVDQDGAEVAFINRIDVPPGRLLSEWTKEEIDQIKQRAMFPPAIKPTFIQPMMPSKPIPPRV